MTSDARHSSESNEHYSPDSVVERARAALDGIDLDPASCATANERVRAARFFTKADNGFLQPWHGRVFLNPPGGWCDSLGREVIKSSKKTKGCIETGACGLAPGHTHTGTDSSQKRWWQELATQWEVGRVTSGIFVSFSIELLQTTQIETMGALPLDFPICYPAKRVAYMKPDGTEGGSPTHASAIICVTKERDVIERFRLYFGDLGRVVVPDTLSVQLCKTG